MLGAKTFFKSIFPKVLEFVTQKREARSVSIVLDVLISLADRLPLPVTVKQVLDPMLNLLYYDACFMELVLEVSKHMGQDFIRFQLYPRLVQIANKAVLTSGKGQRARQRIFRPTPQVSEHLNFSLMLLQAILKDIEPMTVMGTLIEDTLHKDIQQPSILFQILLLPYPDLKILSGTSNLLVEGAMMGGGKAYVRETLLPNLEPIFFVSDDSTMEYVMAISYLYKKLRDMIGDEAITKATSNWCSIEKARSTDTKVVVEGLHRNSELLNTSMQKGRKTRKKDLSYRWLRKKQDKPILPFTPIMPQGIKVAPESYMTSLEGDFESGFKCVHQFKLSVSKVKFMVAEEIGQLVLGTRFLNLPSTFTEFPCS